MPAMKTVDNILKASDSQLDGYFKMAKQLSILTDLVKTVLPNILKPHCVVASYKETRLTLQVSNGAWASQLRYLIPDLIPKLKTLSPFTDLTAIHYFVAPASAHPRAPASKPLELSAANAQLILETAEHIPGKLGEILRKIAAHGKKP